MGWAHGGPTEQNKERKKMIMLSKDGKEYRLTKADESWSFELVNGSSATLNGTLVLSLKEAKNIGDLLSNKIFEDDGMEPEDG